MVAEKILMGLRPDMREYATRFEAECAKHSIDALIYCGFRSPEQQAALWRVGRTKDAIDEMILKLRRKGQGGVSILLEAAGPQPGKKIVTNALPYQSAHNWGLAIDAVPLYHGKALWNDAASITKMGECGETVGLEWAGRWKTFKESVHFQHTNFYQSLKNMPPR